MPVQIASLHFEHTAFGSGHLHFQTLPDRPMSWTAARQPTAVAAKAVERGGNATHRKYKSEKMKKKGGKSESDYLHRRRLMSVSYFTGWPFWRLAERKSTVGGESYRWPVGFGGCFECKYK